MLDVTGRTANDWYRIEQSEGDVYISGKLLGTEKVVIQQQSTGGNNQQTNDNVQQTPAETQPPAQPQQPQQPSGGEPSLGLDVDGGGTAFIGEFGGLGDL